MKIHAGFLHAFAALALIVQVAPAHQSIEAIDELVKNNAAIDDARFAKPVH